MKLSQLKLVIVLTVYAVCRCHAQVIGFSPSNYTVKESDRTLLVTAMVLEGYIPEGENVTVTVSTEEGSATGGADYKTIKNELLTFDNETSVQTVTVTVFEDNIVEDEEEFFLALTEQSRIVKRTSFGITTPVASIFISDTSPVVDLALAIGLGVGLSVALGITTPIVIGVIVYLKYSKKNNKVGVFNR